MSRLLLSRWRSSPSRLRSVISPGTRCRADSSGVPPDDRAAACAACTGDAAADRRWSLSRRTLQLRVRGRRAGARACFSSRASANDRRPVVILLHGTGSRKEEFLALMRTFADRGFATAAIDARHHGSRIAPKYWIRQRAVFCGDARHVSHRQRAAVFVRHRLGRDAARRLSRDARGCRPEAHRRDGHLERGHRGVSCGRGRSANRGSGADHRRPGIPVGARQQSVAGAGRHVCALPSTAPRATQACLSMLRSSAASTIALRPGFTATTTPGRCSRSSRRGLCSSSTATRTCARRSRAFRKRSPPREALI